MSKTQADETNNGAAGNDPKDEANNGAAGNDPKEEANNGAVGNDPKEEANNGAVGYDPKEEASNGVGGDQKNSAPKVQKKKASTSARKGLKRKLVDLELEENLSVIRVHVATLTSTFSSKPDDRRAAMAAIHALSELAKIEENVGAIVECEAVPPLVKHLKAPPRAEEGEDGPMPLEHEVESGSAYLLGLLAVKRGHQQSIVDAGALPHLLALLWRHIGGSSRGITDTIRMATNAIRNLAHENSNIKSIVRSHGGIDLLVELLGSLDTEVQKVAAKALQTLAYKDVENANQIVECDALPTLILMLQSEDSDVHVNVVGLMETLVHSSPSINKALLLAGALLPVIRLWSSPCLDTQRNAALLLCQFAITDSNCKANIIEGGGVRVLNEMLQPPDVELNEMSAFALERLAQQENQKIIVDAGVLPHLLTLLKRHTEGSSRATSAVTTRATYAVSNLARGNSGIKSLLRSHGGIPVLVELLKSPDKEVQKAATKALNTVVSQDVESQKQIVQCNAIPIVMLMLQSDSDVQYDAVCLLQSLNVSTEALRFRALQPVIRLLSSSSASTQTMASKVLYSFVKAKSDCKVHIVQRGAVGPLVRMLKSNNAHVADWAALILGTLAEDTHNQAGIAHEGAIVSLLRLLDQYPSLKHNAGFALHGLAGNEDNILELIRVGGFQKLLENKVVVQTTTDYISKTLTKLEENIQGELLNQLVYAMRVSNKAVQKRVALVLAHVCSSADLKMIFIDNNGLDLLLGLLESTSPRQIKFASVALCKLACKVCSPNPPDEPPISPTSQVYLGEEFVNNPKTSDVSFLVEGKRFYAHRVCLVASSDAFRAMLDGGYREKVANDIEIPNIRWDVFELMMRFIYTGSASVNLDIAQDLLKAADQYLLDCVKSRCENVIAQNISAENVSLMYEISEEFNAMSLRNRCILFILEQFDKPNPPSWYSGMIRRILPEIRNYFTQILLKSVGS